MILKSDVLILKFELIKFIFYNLLIFNIELKLTYEIKSMLVGI